MKLTLVTQTPEVHLVPPVALLSGAFEERLEKAGRMGYDGVELMVARPDELNARELKAQLQAHKLQAAAIASGPVLLQDKLSLLAATPEIARAASTRLDGMVRLAEALEAPLVTIGSFRGRLAWAGGPEAVSGLAETLFASAEQAARRGVRLALEPLNRYETDLIQNAAEGLQFLSQIDHDCLGLLLDTFHMNIEEGDIPAALRRVQAAGKLFHIHLGDSNRLPPGEGHFDFAGLVHTLQQVGYGGYLSAELFPYPDPDTAARWTAERMRGWMGSAAH